MLSRLLDFIVAIGSNPIVVKIVNVGLILLILIFGIMTFYQMLSIKDQRKYVFGPFKGNQEEGKKKFSFLPKGFEESLRKQLLSVNIHVDPSEYLYKYFITAILIVVGFPLVGIISNQNLFVFSSFGLIIGILVIVQPIKAIKKYSESIKLQIRLELPEFMESFALYLHSQSLYETTMRSINFAGPRLYPYVEKLLVDVELSPGSDKPYKDFAKSLDVPEVENFIVSIVQTVNVDKKRATEIINEELEVLEDLRENAYNQKIDESGSKLNGLIFLNVMPALGFSFAFILYTALQMFNEVYGNMQ